MRQASIFKQPTVGGKSVRGMLSCDTANRSQQILL